MNAIDFANYAGEFTDDYVKLIRDSNRKVIVGTQDASIAMQQATLCEDHCLEVDLYQFNYFSVPIEREAIKSRDVAAALKQQPFLWLDFEDELPQMVLRELHPDVILGWINRVVERAQHDFDLIGIYTRENWWREYTGNSNEFASYALWNAKYDGIADLNVHTPYGGWLQQTMKQYQADFVLFGKAVDLNVY